MASFRLQGFEEILEGVRQAIQWCNSWNVKTSGSRLEKIETHVAEVIEGIARADRDEFFQGRPHRSDYWAIVDGASFKSIWEQFRHLKSNQVPRRVLKEAIRGQGLDPADEQPGSGNENPRNFQAQLEVAARVAESGIQVRGFDDVQFEYQSIPFQVECKRVARKGQLAANVGKANTQLRERFGNDGCGLIAIAPEKLLELDEEKPLQIRSEDDLDQLVLRLSDDFYRNHGSAFGGLDDRVIAIMLIFRFVCHDLSHGGYSVANYTTLTPRYPGDHPYGELTRALAHQLRPKT